MSHDVNKTINDFEAGIQRVRDAFAGLTDADLDTKPSDGTWTLRQIAYHLAHSDAIGIDRMLRIAFEQKPPLLIGYDETAGTLALYSDAHPIEELLTLFDLNRKAFVRIARRLPGGSWERFGIHSEAGKTTLLEQLRKYVQHADHHLVFVMQKRTTLGK
ncbi:MAG: DinB family protein [Tepidisphaeraceae bacterium]